MKQLDYLRKICALFFSLLCFMLINTVQAAPSVYFPTSVTLINARPDGDNLSYFQGIDADTYDVRYKLLGGKHIVDWYASTTINENPSLINSIKITHVGQYSLRATAQDVYVYNFQTSEWELIDSATVDNQDDYVVTKTLSGNLSHYISSQKELRLRVKGVRASGNLYSWSNYLSWEVNASTTSSATKAPIGIVYSKTTEEKFFQKKAYAQLFMSVQSQAMMAGLPYDLLSEDDLLDLNKIKDYKTLVFPYFANVKKSQLSTIEQNLTQAVNQYHVGIITAGDFLTNDETGAAIGTFPDYATGDAYSRMKNLLKVRRISGSNGAVDVQYNIASTSHPITSGEYNNNENIKFFNGIFTNYFEPMDANNASIIATQTIENNLVKNALITTQNGGRHAHFATIAHMVDVNLLWSVMQWSVYGDKSPVSLQMSRNKAIFISRNDMDQSMFLDEVVDVNGALLTVLQTWKDEFNFVGSYYINVGNNPTELEQTDWSYSAPLYQNYMALGNEIGTHSYTHPDNTALLSPEQIRFEFEDSRSVIEQNLGITNIGGAVPGAPEPLLTASEIIQHVDYLSGGYSSYGAGYANAFGFLSPTSDKVYLSPNMSFDFTLIEFQHRTAEQAKQIWFNEFDTLVAHNNQALIHWPWHDYGPNDSGNAGYTFDMFNSFISKAHQFGSEFITGKDFSNRIKAFKSSRVAISQQGNTITANVAANNIGQFSLKVPASSKISSVDNWYAYNDKQVFLDDDGGQYTINLGSTAASVTHITQLPSRSKLLAVTGNGTNLQFQLNGEGEVKVKLKCATSNVNVSGGTTTFSFISSSEIKLNFSEDVQHAETSVNVNCDASTPAKATLVSPSGNISDTTPVYTWNAVSNATWYYLWVNDSSGNKIRKWYTASQVGCNSGNGTCSISPNVSLLSGNGRWWIQTWNPSGYGSWSNPMTFNVVSGSLPQKATLVSPNATISDNTPEYVWNAVSNATWYYLWVNDSSGNKIKKWYTSAQAGCSSGAGTCSITPSNALNNGNAVWWIQTWNPSGYGSWSNPMTFNVN